MTADKKGVQKPLPPLDERARVFVSCGQRANTDEVAIAHTLLAELEKLGFAPYVAVREQSLRSLRENVFDRLRDFEYFLFIDFRRELLVSEDKKQLCRGSLFSHQELAIASFQDTPIIAFQESGVRPRDGLIGHLQANCTEFKDRTTLVPQILERVKAEWRNHWQNRLEMTITNDRLGPRFRKADENNRIVRWAFLTVRNHHRSKAAQDCYGYLISARNAETGTPVPFQSAEQKWSGYVFPSARIAPSSTRRLDAFFVSEDEPMVLRLPCFTDSTEFRPRIMGPGPWVLTYEVVSENIPGTRFPIVVRLAQNLEEVTITPA